MINCPFLIHFYYKSGLMLLTLREVFYKREYKLWKNTPQNVHILYFWSIAWPVAYLQIASTHILLGGKQLCGIAEFLLNYVGFIESQHCKQCFLPCCCCLLRPEIMHSRIWEFLNVIKNELFYLHKNLEVNWLVFEICDLH